MSCLICRAIKMEVMSHSLTMAAGAAASPATALSRRGRSGSTSLSCYSSFPAPPSAGHHNHPASASHEASLKHQFLSLPRRWIQALFDITSSLSINSLFFFKCMSPKYKSMITIVYSL